MSLLSATFLTLHSAARWPEHSVSEVVIGHDPREFIASLTGYAASAAVLGTFLMRQMVPLRLIAILSNILFIGYGYAEHIYPVLSLHVALLPINVHRLLAAPGGEWRQIRWVGIARALHNLRFGRRHAILFVFGVLAGSAGGWVIIRILGVMHA